MLCFLNVWGVEAYGAEFSVADALRFRNPAPQAANRLNSSEALCALLGLL